MHIKRYFLFFLFWGNVLSAQTIIDHNRQRNIPIEIHQPKNISNCTSTNKCAVAFLSAGYGVPHTKYNFISKQLNKLDYLVISIAHELPSDPPLSVKGDLYKTRSENWQRGATTLDFLQKELAPVYNNFDFNNLLLVGHSNGGDISAWLANERKPYIAQLITLDHRRVPLPRNKAIKVTSIRASDFPADEGVLLTHSEQVTHKACIIKIPKSKHNDMSDFGPDWLKTKINIILKTRLTEHSCFKNTS